MVNTRGFDPETGEWNDSLTGDFIWGNANIGEAMACVMTPFTWSIIGMAYDYMNVLPGYSVAGNIGGRPYQNGTVMVSALKAIGKDVDAMFQEMAGSEKPPEGLTIPLIPISGQDKISILFSGIRLQFKERAGLRRLPRFLAENPAWCADFRRRARAATGALEIAHLWREIAEHSVEAFWPVVGITWRYAEVVAPLRRELVTLVGEADAGALLSGISTETEMLACLGPVVSLSRVARGEMSRHAYLEQYGHRGPDEVEFAAPRPAEDPAWLDRQLALLADDAVASADELLARQRARFETAWASFRQCYPDRAETMQERLVIAAQVSRTREAVRSELTRQVW
ncbi:MAG: pyruvate, phosphate dikinase, partial [Anaerolineae bacterium]